VLLLLRSNSVAFPRRQARATACATARISISAVIQAMHFVTALSVHVDRAFHINPSPNGGTDSQRGLAIRDAPRDTTNGAPDAATK
jgi:hypothetical protein